MKDTLFGQYIFGNSILHHADPRTKILMLLMVIPSIFFINSFLGLILYLLFILVLTKRVGLTIYDLKKGIRFSLVFIFFALFSGIFKDNGQRTYIISSMPISYFGLQLALKNAFRVVLVIITSIVVTRSTTPLDFIRAVDKISEHIKIFKREYVREIAFIMVVALSFIPIILEEAEKINKAQKARGIDQENRGIITKLKRVLKILGPLFISTFRRAESLSMAIESRCYGSSNNRTSISELKFRKIDLQVALLFIFIILAAISLNYSSFIHSKYFI
jgi:energy-coupling factor transport system permease protein